MGDVDDRNIDNDRDRERDKLVQYISEQQSSMAVHTISTVVPDQPFLISYISSPFYSNRMVCKLIVYLK